MTMTNVFLASVALAAVSISSAGSLDNNPWSQLQVTSLYDLLRNNHLPTSALIIAAPDANAIADSKIQNEPRYKVGITVPLNVTVNLGTVTPRVSAKPVAVTPGAIQFSPDGFVWSAVVNSPGASSLRLGIEGLALPDGVALHLYNDHGQVDGPYTGKGRPGHRMFYTQTLAGDRLYLQISYRGTNTASMLDAINFTLTGVAHLDERFLRGRAAARHNGREHCSNLNASCVQNAECNLHDSTVDPVVESLRDASAHMLFQSGAAWYICSGTLIESLDGTQGHFLTANHCISTASEAASLETYFHFTTPCPAGGGPTTSCNYANSGNSNTPPSFGAAIIDTSPETDFTLLMLDGAPPAGTRHLPFSTTPVATNDGVDLYRISYPSGAPQAFSKHEVDGDWDLCGIPGNFIYSIDIIGATEGGSSGSAIVNSNGEIVGQLYGACGLNTGNECDTVNNRTYDGAFAATWQNRPLVRNALASNCSDGDFDGVCDTFDNCTLVENPSQCDTNGDGIGNHCDADLDNNGIVNSFDLTIMRDNFGASGVNDADLDCNEIVNSFDLTIMRSYFGETL